MRNEIVLIGPVSVGKTTVGKYLAERLSVPLVEMDDHRLRYYAEIGYSDEHRMAIGQRLGESGVYRYWKVFDAYSVKRLFQEHKNCIFDMGGGTTSCEFGDEFEKTEEALSPFRNVFLLLPTPDKAESLKFLYDRMQINPPGWTILQHLVYNHANEAFAEHTIYVKGKTPEQIGDEILAAAQLPLREDQTDAPTTALPRPVL